ncbi:hypothetical protein SAMN04488128_103729 [Chitinophaga eiseniae]|uniref:Uncharacterized protein n=1 Tax=Chitinophaga eiseniae TaxID=634771 RepID=A0A1T4SY89_9BACT|nr:hypothetical protein [Chitinophaga eiseniae]SKA32878.1 hypothetical protein SAMN04488128_103729 [Chitinophaga eiseniae]
MIINHQLIFSINESLPIFFLACFDSLSSLDKFSSIPNNGTKEHHFCTCDLMCVRNGNSDDRQQLQRSYLASRLDLAYSIALLLDLPQYGNAEDRLLIKVSPPKKILPNGLWQGF